MITSSGPRCDICGKYIMPIFEEMVNVFTISGISRELHADNSCAEALGVAAEAGDWRLLPPGPLRSAFEKQ